MMTDCHHCGTPFKPGKIEDRFCCKGCEFVNELILEEGLDRYYTLRQDKPVKPVRSLPFEAHDFTWLEEKVRELEASIAVGKGIEADFSLEGISCIGCVWLTEKIYMRQVGALQADAYPATGRLHLRWVAGEMDLPAFAREMASFGYRLAPRKSGKAASESGQLGFRLGLCGAFMMNAMAFTLPSYLGMPETFAFSGIFQLITLLTATLSMLVGGSYFISRAWKAAKMKILHIDLPIALGLIAAYLGSLIGWIWKLHSLLYFDFVATFVFLMLLGRYIQLSAMEKNRHRLQRQRPVPESVASPDQEEAIPLDALSEGVRFELEPGQSIPVAAMLENASAEFSLEWINGEAEPQTFQPGRPLPAGAIYLGYEKVILTALETWSESLLSKLLMTDRASIRVPALENLLKFYLATVLIVGLGALVWSIVHHSVPHGLQVMISVFVVSCPCALGVALPMADEIAGSLMERAGVFIRQPLLWGRLHRVKTLIFDKTGTLTLERPVLINADSIDDLTKKQKQILARLTQGSLHPVSRSLLENLGREGQLLLREALTLEVYDVPGAGRFLEANGEEWSLGKPGWKSLVSDQEAKPHDAVLACNGTIIAHFEFHESLRSDAVAALRWLQKKHYRCIILSGDNASKVSATAAQLGISAEDAHAALLPAEKEKLVRKLDSRDTLYLGDGANDSLAFNAAWTTGTPIVDRSLLENKADFYFMGQSLQFLPLFISLAKRRKAAVSFAFAFALCYNMTAVAISLAGHMSPLLAAILMPLSSVVSLGIVAFGLKVRKKKASGVDLQSDPLYDSVRNSSSISPDDVTHSERLRPSSV